jgi:hypothetical protein
MKQQRTQVTALMVLTLLPLFPMAAEDAAIAATHAAVIEYYNNHPVIEAAVWTDRNVFNVGIHFMGSSEDTMADDICKVLASHDLPRNVRVRVIDINSMGKDQRRWEVVGQSTCQ